MGQGVHHRKVENEGQTCILPEEWTPSKQGRISIWSVRDSRRSLGMHHLPKQTKQDVRNPKRERIDEKNSRDWRQKSMLIEVEGVYSRSCNEQERQAWVFVNVQEPFHVFVHSVIDPSYGSLTRWLEERHPYSIQITS